MEQEWDFMEQTMESLKSVVSNYDTFCDVAEQLESIDFRVWHDDYGNNNPCGVHFNAIAFPEDYILLNNIADAYIRAVLSDTAFYKRWYRFCYDEFCKNGNRDFWNIPQDERKKYLIECRTLYEGLVVVKEPQFVMRDWEYLVHEINTFARVEHISMLSNAKDLNQFENAKVLEIGGCVSSHNVYLAMKRHDMLLVTCGCWQ